MFNIYSVEETCSDGLGSWPYWNHRNQNYEIVGPWWPDVYRHEKWIWNLDNPQKACLSRHQPEDIKKLFLFSVKPNARFMFKGPKASKGFFRPETWQFSLSNPDFLVFVEVFGSRCREDYQSRGAPDVATRALGDGWLDPDMAGHERRLEVMKWRFTTEVSNIGCMMFRKFYIYYSILVSVSVQDACQPH